MTVSNPHAYNKWYFYHNRLVTLHNNNNVWSFYFKVHGWYWYMQTTFGFTISLLWRGGDQGCWRLNASSLDEIWWLKQHTDRSPNSLQWQLGLPDKLCLLQERGLEMDVIVRNTKLTRCGGSSLMFLFCRTGKQQSSELFETKSLL